METLKVEILESLKSIFGKTFNLFSKDEVLILATAYLEGSVNNARIQLMIDKHSYDITEILHDLVEKETLVVDGYGRGKVYYLNLDYDSILKEVDESNLSEDEIKIIDYINENGSINNQQSRDTLAFGKDKKGRLKQQYKVCIKLNPDSSIKRYDEMPTRCRRVVNKTDESRWEHDGNWWVFNAEKVGLKRWGVKKE